MKYIFIFGIFIILTNCINIGKQDIILDTNINLGKIQNGIPQDFFIKCRNNYNKKIILKEIHTSCGCIKEKEKNNYFVNALDSSLFHFQFIPEGIGYVERTISLYFDFSPEPYIVKIRARIISNANQYLIP